jgi:hypothetical protein
MDLKTIRKRQKNHWSGIKVGQEFTMKAFHHDMQERRENGEDVTLKSFPTEMWGDNYTPEQFYRDAGIDLEGMTVQKILSTDDLNRWLFPEIFRDAIRRGLEYTPFYKFLITGEERIEGTGVTMPYMDLTGINADDVRLRDTTEGSNIPEGEVFAWSEKQVSIRKKARGLKQTYESLMFTPINLATVYFEEVGVRLGADLDADLINVAINGDQADLSESSPVIGAATANTLVYMDIVRAWIRFRRIGRNPVALLTNETDALGILVMSEFQRSYPQGGAPANPGGTAVNIRTPLPTQIDIWVHDAVPTKQILFIDPARAFVQLTAMPLLIESERIVARQLVGEYVSLMTGFANVFRDGRMILNWATNLSTNPGPVVPT